ncbi:MAG: hypothetical protein ACK4OM_04045 [Alphaproteobacteria bacterium]
MKPKNIIKFIGNLAFYSAFHRLIIFKNIALFAANILINIFSSIGIKTGFIKDANYSNNVRTFCLRDFHQLNSLMEEPLKKLSADKRTLYNIIISNTNFSIDYSKGYEENLKSKAKIIEVIFNLINKNDEKTNLILASLFTPTKSAKITFIDRKYVSNINNYIVSSTIIDSKNDRKETFISLNYDNRNVEATLTKELTLLFCHQKYGKYYNINDAKKSMSYYVQAWHKLEDFWAYLMNNSKVNYPNQFKELSSIDYNNQDFSIFNPYNFYDSTTRKGFKEAGLKDGIFTRASYFESLIYKPFMFHIYSPCEQIYNKIKSNINLDHASYWAKKNEDLIDSITPSLNSASTSESKQEGKDQKFENLFIKEISKLPKKDRHAQTFAKISEARALFGDEYVKNKIKNLYSLYERQLVNTSGQSIRR